ncbi:MAG: hypothetical protein O2861_16665, partial [Proteobacteria bacterium]|nr:hypothetical protein [Pseudomonadota bacterium]
ALTGGAETLTPRSRSGSESQKIEAFFALKYLHPSCPARPHFANRHNKQLHNQGLATIPGNER